MFVCVYLHLAAMSHEVICVTVDEAHWSGRAAGAAVLTACHVSGMIARLQAELGSIRPPDQAMPFFMSAEPLLDTWRGAAALAAGHNNSGSAGGGGVMGGMFGDPFAAGNGALTRAAYEEAGPEYLREFRGFKYPEL
jgi:hypothetical protein